MRIRYYLVDDTESLFAHSGEVGLPRIGDMVFLKEIFFVDNVVFYPVDNEAKVFLKDEPPRKAKVAEAKENVVNLNDVRQAKTDSAKALKETASLKRELVSVRQYIRSSQESKK